ncbi:MAG TPA: nucleoside monophosphate kinase [Candidatus Paceibacterota bacterium]
MQPQTFIFFGTSGSGKGTQARFLIDELKKKDPKRRTLYLETGEKLREFASKDSFTSKKAKEALDAGSLMPEFLPVWVWAQFFIDNVKGDENVVLDGVARREHEAVIIDSVMKFYNRENPTIIFIDVSPEWATDKLEKRAKTEGREDDREEEIKRRMDWFEKNVVPAIKHFKSNPYYKFISINGEQTIEEVHQEILGKIGL